MSVGTKANNAVRLAVSAFIAAGAYTVPAQSAGNTVRISKGQLTAELFRNARGVFDRYRVLGQDNICDPRTLQRGDKSCCPDLRRAYTRLSQEVLRQTGQPLQWTGSAKVCVNPGPSYSRPTGSGPAQQNPGRQTPGGGNPGGGNPGGNPGGGNPGGNDHTGTGSAGPSNGGSGSGGPGGGPSGGSGGGSGPGGPGGNGHSGPGRR